MPLNTTGTVIQSLVIIRSVITRLALASLSSATARFAIVLQDRAKSDHVTPSEPILDITFKNVMDQVLEGMVAMALISALFSIFGIILVIYSRWLRSNCEARITMTALNSS